MDLRARISTGIILLASILALVPLMQLSLDWYKIAGYQDFAGTPLQTTARGSDWIEWTENDGSITAEFVFPHGPGADAGIQSGDRFYMFDYQQYFDIEGLENAISGGRPGDKRDLVVVRGHQIVETQVTLTRSPTFLYPRSSTLWKFGLWGFTLGAFIHILGLFIAGPLAIHTRRALFEFLLIAVSSLWIFGNLLRLALVEILGPPATGSTYDYIFQSLTLFAFFGWIGFPVLLLYKIQAALVAARSGWIRGVSLLIYIAPGLLIAGVSATTLLGHLGPIALEDLLVPILFYASCYISAASAVVLISFPSGRTDEDAGLGNWGRTGTGFVLVIAVMVALIVLGIVPALVSLTEIAAGWMIVGAQLLAVAPIALFSLGTLRHGKVDDVLTRGFIYVFILGSIFFAFVGGITLMENALSRMGSSRIAVEGMYVVVLLILFDRFGRRLSVVASSFFASERKRARQQLASFQHKMTDFVDVSVLAERTARVLGDVFQARSAAIFLPAHSSGDWVIGSFHPEAPYLTGRVFAKIWSFFTESADLWARNPELNELELPVDVVKTLLGHGVALAVPIRIEERALGLVVLGLKNNRKAVYNLEDLEQLRLVAGQLVLAVERLALIERERNLARESSNAHLVALRSQINPHFLFNALNTILSLIAERPEEAETVVENLASIFRYTLHTGSDPFVRLQDEIELVENYLQIERARFGDRLKIECELDADLFHYPVPAFAVQTLVENAIKHGLERRRSGGSLSIICARRDKRTIEVRVSDTGVGIPALFGDRGHVHGIGSFFGLGLTNVASRLEELFGRDDLLRINSDPEIGTSVVLMVPVSESKSVPLESVRKDESVDIHASRS